MGQIIDLFSGIGGFSLAGHWQGWETVIFCEINKFAQAQLQKNFPGVAIHQDIKTLNREIIENAGWDSRKLTAVCGGFPCQPASVAGKRKGKTDARWLWPEMLRIITEIKPDWVIAENVPGLLSLSVARSEIRLGSEETADRVEDSVFEHICQDLEEIGYEVQAFVIPAGAVGAIHYRERVWILANANRNGSPARTIQGFNGQDDAGRPKREKEGIETDRNFSTIRAKQLHQNSDANPKRLQKSQVSNVSIESKFNPGPYATKRTLNWNPNRSEVLRAGNGLPDWVDCWERESGSGD